MVAEQKALISEKKTVPKEKKVSFVRQIKQTLKKVKFLSLPETFKRLGIVTIIVTLLSLLVAALDYGITYGISALENVTFDGGVFKIIVAVVFLICATVLIILETFRRSKTKGFSVTNNNVNKRYKIGDDHLSTAIRALGIVSFVLCVVLYLMK